MSTSSTNVLGFRTSTYARNIYIFGTTVITTIPAEYYTPVEQYAANNYTLAQIDNALSQGWISKTVYDETIALIAIV